MNLIAQEPTHVERPARMRLQLTLRRAADKIGISPTDLSYLEQGRYTLSESDWDELFAKLEGR